MNSDGLIKSTCGVLLANRIFFCPKSAQQGLGARAPLQSPSTSKLNMGALKSVHFNCSSVVRDACCLILKLKKLERGGSGVR